MKDRIRAVRKYYGLTQARFAEKLGVSISTTQKWDIGDTVPSASAVTLICDMFSVSERWLRTGEGEMLRPISREQELAEFVGTLFRDDTPEFRRRLVTVLARMDDTGLAVLERIADELIKKEG